MTLNEHGVKLVRPYKMRRTHWLNGMEKDLNGFFGNRNGKNQAPKSSQKGKI